MTASDLYESASPVLREIASIRAAAWQATSLKADPRFWLDEWDLVAQHHIVLRDGVVAAAFRFTLHDTVTDLPHREVYGDLVDHLPGPIAWSARLVVAPEWKGKGLSSALDGLAANEPFKHGARSIVATGGSVLENSFRHEVMNRHGWQHLGTAVSSIDLPLAGGKPPDVFGRIKVDLV